MAPPRGNRPTPSPIGRAIARFRNARGWSQERLAEIAGISRVTIARLETGARQDGTPETLRAVARALEVPLSAVMGEEVGVQKIDDLLKQFRSSAWSQTMRPPPSDGELESIRDLGDAVWTKMPASDEAIYHLILALRSGKNSPNT